MGREVMRILPSTNIVHVSMKQLQLKSVNEAICKYCVNTQAWLIKQPSQAGGRARERDLGTA